jgi:FkbM family methyltransferase
VEEFLTDSLNILSYQAARNILISAYKWYGVDLTEGNFLSSTQLTEANLEQKATLLFERSKQRLEILGHSGSLLEDPVVVCRRFGQIDINVCAINQQGVDWYIVSEVTNYDFMIEESNGLLPSSGKIIDLGAHQGLWSMYYCLRDKRTQVTCFEPSIINIEALCINMVLNCVDNLQVVPMAAGVKSSEVARDASDSMLVDFVGGGFPVVNFQTFCGGYVDFMKVDIEGFEYDLISNCSNFFELARNFHLELHIPHLKRRNLDYKDVYERIPFDKFDVTDWQSGSPVIVHAASELDGYCSLMMRRL